MRFQNCDAFTGSGNGVSGCTRRSAIGNHGLIAHSIQVANSYSGTRNRIIGNLVYDNVNELFSWSELKTFISTDIDEG